MPLATLEEARALIAENRHVGVRCPCCDRFVKVYRRTVTHSQVRFLAELYAETRVRVRTEDGVDVRTIQGQHMRGGDYSKLRHWGLIEKLPEAGHWRITGLGVSFLAGHARIPKYVHVEGGQVVRFGTEMMDVHAAYGQTFDLREVMAVGLDIDVDAIA